MISSGPKGEFQGRSLKSAVNSTPSQPKTQIPVLMPPLEPELSSHKVLYRRPRHKYLQDETRFQNITALSSQEEKDGYEGDRSHGNSSAKASPLLHLSLHCQEHLEDWNHCKSHEIHQKQYKVLALNSYENSILLWAQQIYASWIH